jgi:protein-arginine kinase activator protein McsA
MKAASKHLDFELAAILRDEIKELSRKKLTEVEVVKKPGKVSRR